MPIKSKYLDMLAQFNIEPNFECSQEYFSAAGWTEHIQQGKIKVMDKEGCQMLPSLDVQSGKILNDPCFIGLPNMSKEISVGPLLDQEFIYAGLPHDFDFAGGPWKTTRKNMRKAEKELGGILGFELVQPYEEQGKYQVLQAAIEKMLIDWGGNRDMFAPDLFCHFALNGQNRIIVRTPEKMIVALLAWDGNYKYVNFRVCLTAPVDGLSDWCRIKFRQIIGRKFPKHLINDGGVCKNPTLLKYKKRLCPEKINDIYSIEKPEAPTNGTEI